MEGRDVGRGGFGVARGLPSPGLGRGGGLDRGQGRGVDFGQVHPDAGLIVAQGGWDEGEEDSEDHVPLIRWQIMRDTRVETPAGGEGGGDDAMRDIPQQDVPQQESIDDLREQIDNLREQVQALIVERDRVVRRYQDTQATLDHIQQVGFGTLSADTVRALYHARKEIAYWRRRYEDLVSESQRVGSYVTTHVSSRMDTSSGGVMGPPQRSRDQGGGPFGGSSFPQPQR